MGKANGIAIRRALVSEAGSLRLIREEAANALTVQFGRGHWSSVSSIETIRSTAAEGILFCILKNSTIVGTLTVTNKKIGFYKKSWFSDPAAPAHYLFRMAVRPCEQRKGIGRAIMRELEKLAKREGSHAIRLDAYSGPTGAGAFYRKCGYDLVNKGEINGVELEYYEKVLASPNSPLEPTAAGRKSK